MPIRDVLRNLLLRPLWLTLILPLLLFPNASFSALPNVAECVARPGSYCMNEVLIPCPGGSFCPTQKDGPIRCGKGTYCPPLSSRPTPCPPNMYCPRRGMDAPTECPKGMYCKDSSTLFEHMSDGEAIDCPKGYYNSEKGSSYCTRCPQGTFSKKEGRTTACKSCAAGTYCPLEGMTGEIVCPADHYCPSKKTIEPTACPPGRQTYVKDRRGKVTQTGLSSNNACRPIRNIPAEYRYPIIYPCESDDAKCFPASN
jgi:hypothetical protein